MLLKYIQTMVSPIILKELQMLKNIERHELVK